jgi:hypothetical protein
VVLWLRQVFLAVLALLPRFKCAVGVEFKGSLPLVDSKSELRLRCNIFSKLEADSCC